MPPDAAKSLPPPDWSNTEAGEAAVDAPDGVVPYYDPYDNIL